MSQPNPTPSAPKPMAGKFSGIVVDSSRTTPNFKIPAKTTNRTLPTPPGSSTSTSTTTTTTAISPDINNNSNNNTTEQSTTTLSEPIKQPLKSVPKPRPIPQSPQSNESNNNTTTTLEPSKPNFKLVPKPQLKTNATNVSPSVNNNNKPTPPSTSLKPNVLKSSTTSEESNSTVIESPPPTNTTSTPVITPTPTPLSTPTVIPNRPNLSSFKSKPLPSTSKSAPTTPPISSSTSSPLNEMKLETLSNNSNITTPPTNSNNSSPRIINNSFVSSSSVEISEIAKQSSIDIKKSRNLKDTVRVLSNKKGDFNSLSVTRGDIIQVIEKGEKDQYLGSNGYKTASFSISNTKDLYPYSNNPPKSSPKAIAIKDIKSNRNFTIIRGDILCVLEKKSDTVSAGRVKVGLDGWGEMGEFPNDSIRVINDEEYLLYSDLLDTIIEVSEKLMDPESLVTSGTKETEKEMEKRQLALRDKVKNVQITREKILVSSENDSIKCHQIELRRDIEIIRSILSNEFYIVNDQGEITSEENSSPLTLLKEYYNLSNLSEKKGGANLNINPMGNISKGNSGTGTNGTGQDKSKSELYSGQDTSSSKSQQEKSWEYGQLLVDLKFSRCTLPRGKNFEFYFSLYNSTQSRYLSEQVMIVYDQSNSNTTPIPSAFKFIFKNIESIDLTDDVCLICKVIRKGSIKDIDEINSNGSSNNGNTNGKESKSKNSSSGSKEKDIEQFRRPYAFACFKFQQSIFESQVALERDITLSFFTSSNESNFPSIPDILARNNEEEMKKQSIEPVPKLVVGVSQSILPISISFYDMIYSKFIEKYPISYSWIKSEKLSHKTLLAEKVHQFYLTIDHGKFSQGKKLELTCRVRLDNGDFLSNCLAMGVGTSNNFSSEVKSTVCYNTTNPVWNETIQFNINQEQFPKSHLLLTIRNCSSKEKDKKDFAFTFIKLGNNDQTVILNSDHTIQLFKSNSDQIPISNYIELNPYFNNNSSSSSDKSNTNTSSIRKGEFIKLKSYLNSSEFIQHQSINQLLNWKSSSNESSTGKNSSEELHTLLEKFKFVDPIQIMRHLNRILDSLFRIYDTTTTSSFEVYNTITFIIGLLTEERTNRFKNFKEELDTYINNQFSVSSAHKHILKCISLHLQEQKEGSKISSTLKSLEYMFRLIVKSRLVYLKEKFQNSTMVPKEEEVSWKLEITEFLGLINRLMSNNSPLLIVTQTLALRNFAVVMTGLQNFFSKQEQCKILNEFIEAVHYTEKQEHLNSYKLSIYHKILSTHLLLDMDTLEYLVPTLVSTINQHLTRGSELKLSTQLLSLLLESLQYLMKMSNEKKIKLFNNVMVLFSKVMTLNDSILSSLAADIVKESFNYDSTFLISNFLSLLYYSVNIFKESDGIQSVLEKYIIDLQSEHLIKLFLRKLFRILEGLLNRGVYSNLWPSLQLFHHRVTLDIIIKISPIFYKYINVYTPNLPQPPSGLSHTNSSGSFSIHNINKSGDNSNHMDIESWNTIFNLNFSILISQSMRNPSNRIHRLKYIKPQVKSIINQVLNSIKFAWEQLKSNQTQYIHYIIPNLIYSLLNGNKIIYEFVQDFFLLIIKKEYTENKSLKRIESRTIEILDKIIIRERISDEEIFKLFLKNRLMVSLSTSQIPESFSFVNNLIQLLSLLFDFRTLPTDRAFEEERTIATLKMMEYFKDRKDTYIKYLHELLNQHINNGYFTEAGFTILLESDLYEWSDQNVPIYSFMMAQNTNMNGSNTSQPITMPQESSSDRKIRLIKLAIQYLDKGQVWEKCITLIQELKNQYEQTFNFKALAEITIQEAEFYEKILSTERLFCEYFRVGYYGKKFPITIQGKEFLYRGFELERLSDFSQRILAKFPNAELLKSTSEPTSEIQNSDAQYLLITIVNASCKEEMEKKQKPFIEGTPTYSINYLKRNDVNLFVYSKPFEKLSEESNPDIKDKNNKFGSLWIKNHFLLTESSFPTIHRRSEVIKKEQVDLSPIENAINSVSQKNDDLDEMVKKYEKNPQLNLNPLAMALNGSIDAAVNGGVSLYKEAFYTGTGSKLTENKVKLMNELKKQVDILGKGLYIHSQRCPEELRGLHEKLESFFPKFKSQVFSLSG